MKKGKVNDDEEQQIDPKIDYAELNNQCFDEVEKRYSEITHVFLTGHGYTLPDGFHFVDENGKTIDASKILLVKNAPSYPKTYEECCDVLNIDPIRKIEYEESWGFRSLTQYDTDILTQLRCLRKLLICRNAYWKIAGKQMGLDKPWEPDWNDNNQPKFGIHNVQNDIRTINLRVLKNLILVFPTEEIRDAFYKNFKELIEQCNKLL